MKAVVKTSAERGVEYVTDYPDPNAADGQVVIEVAAASLCGTDREVYEWTPSAQAFDLDLPVVIGHEGAGTIVEVGAGVDRAPGRRPGRAGEPPDLRTVLPLPDRQRAHLRAHPHHRHAHRRRVRRAHRPSPQDICVQLPDAVLPGGRRPAGVRRRGRARHPALRLRRRRAERSGQRRAVRSVWSSPSSRWPWAPPTSSPSNPTPTAANRPRTIGAPCSSPPSRSSSVCRDLAGSRGGFDVAFECSGVRGVLPSAVRVPAPRSDPRDRRAPQRDRHEIDIAAYINKKRNHPARHLRSPALGHLGTDHAPGRIRPTRPRAG